MLKHDPLRDPPIVLIVQGSRIAFKDVHYYVYTDDAPKASTEGSVRAMFGFGGGDSRSEVHVLRGITGVVERGEIAVILGECRIFRH